MLISPLCGHKKLDSFPAGFVVAFSQFLKSPFIRNVNA